MHRISLAPVLSATRSRDSCWITSVSLRHAGSPESLAELDVDAAPRGCLAYLARSRISTTRHRFVAESGRVSLMRTRSPTPAALPSSCALTLLDRRRTLP